MKMHGLLIVIGVSLVCLGLTALCIEEAIRKDRPIPRSIWVQRDQSPEKYVSKYYPDSPLAEWERLRTRPSEARMVDYIEFIEVVR